MCPPPPVCPARQARWCWSCCPTTGSGTASARCTSTSRAPWAACTTLPGRPTAARCGAAAGLWGAARGSGWGDQLMGSSGEGGRVGAGMSRGTRLDPSDTHPAQQPQLAGVSLGCMPALARRGGCCTCAVAASADLGCLFLPFGADLGCLGCPCAAVGGVPGARGCQVLALDARGVLLQVRAWGAWPPASPATAAGPHDARLAGAESSRCPLRTGARLEAVLPTMLSMRSPPPPPPAATAWRRTRGRA